MGSSCINVFRMPSVFMVKREMFGSCVLGGMIHCLLESVREIFDTGVNTE
jgi:hypothetical protein